MNEAQHLALLHAEAKMPTESAAELAARARVVSSEQWTRFEDHFFHGCCDCGNSHTVQVRRVGDEHEIQWWHHEELTEESRARNEHPLWKQHKALLNAVGFLLSNPDNRISDADVRAANAVLDEIKGTAVNRDVRPTD